MAFRWLAEDQAQPLTHALVIGAGAYPNLGTARLVGTVDGARRLATWLTDEFRCPDAPLGSLEVLVSDEAARSIDQPDSANIQRALTEWLARADNNPGNVALFYFSGHGGSDPATGEQLLIPDDATTKSLRVFASVEQIIQQLDACEANRQLVLIDSGWTKLETPGRATGVRVQLPLERPLNRGVLRASSPGQHAYEAGNLPGHFTRALLDSLQATSEPVRISALARQIRSRVADLTEIDGAKQEPWSELTGDFVLHEPAGSRLAPHPLDDDRTVVNPPAKPARPPRREVPRSFQARPKREPTEIERARSEFAALLSYHLAAGTRPSTLGRAGQPWTDREFAAQIRVAPKTLSAYRTGRALPREATLILRALFADDPSLREGRNELARKFALARGLQSPREETDESQTSRARAPRPDLDFLADDAELDTDGLQRAGLAIMLARRLHVIWRDLNAGAARGRDDDRAGFVLHLDAPWGGGKTTFANFVARVLNPYGFGEKPARFLVERYGQDVDLTAAFAEDPPSAAPPGADRPWIVVPFNAWRMEHCTPPWWAFYQAIRQACFEAIRREGAGAVRPRGRPWWGLYADAARETLDLVRGRPLPPSAPKRPGRAAPWPLRWAAWTYLWFRELAWRLLTPKLLIPFAGLLLTAVTTAVLMAQGVIKVSGEAGKSFGWKAFFDPSSPIGPLMLALTGLTAVGGVISLVVESLAPGVDPLAERLGLGHSDPLDRFRRHFQHTLHRIRRPVLVVVDDLDRCKPEVIVDLVRGMQTILRSPRVVFMILGDRDWIERAFEARNAEMAKVGGGAEQSLGARFVEKAIQMSFLLPGMGEDQTQYVRGLLGRGAGAAAAAVAPPVAQPTIEVGIQLRQEAKDTAAMIGATAFDAQQVRDVARNSDAAQKYITEAQGGLADDKARAAARTAAERQVNQIVNEVLAIDAASAKTEAETAQRLLPLAPWLPPNPRQIKRVLNGVALYHAVALNHPTFSTAGDRWFQLALWVVIMTEWPMTWRLLLACPELADVIAHETPAEALKAVPAGRLPGSYAATLHEVERVCADEALMALIAGRGGREGPRLDTAAVTALLMITPPQARPPRLAEPAAAKAETKP